MSNAVNSNKKLSKAEIFVKQLQPYTDDEPINLSMLQIPLAPYKGIIKRMINQKVLIVDSFEEATFIVNGENFETFLENEKKRRFVIIVAIVIPAILFLLLGLAWSFIAI